MSKVSEHGNQIKTKSKDFFFEEKDTSNAKQYWFVIRELTSRELKRKYARSYLGIVWSILNPLLNMIVVSLIFSYMFRRNIENYPIYYIIGLSVWTLFRTATDTSMTALVDNKQLLIRAKLPKYTFVLSRLYTSIINFGYTAIPLIIIILAFRISITWKALLSIIGLGLLVIFALGMSLILSILYVFFADIKYLYEVLLVPWMYLSALFYPVSALPDYMQTVISYNPVFLVINVLRKTLMYDSLPDVIEWVKLIIYAVLMLIIGVIVFRFGENKVMKKI